MQMSYDVASLIYIPVHSLPSYKRLLKDIVMLFARKVEGIFVVLVHNIPDLTVIDAHQNHEINNKIYLHCRNITSE